MYTAEGEGCIHMIVVNYSGFLRENLLCAPDNLCWIRYGSVLHVKEQGFIE